MQRLVVITGLSQGWKNINPKLNLDELQQIVKPEGTNRLQTHTHNLKMHRSENFVSVATKTTILTQILFLYALGMHPFWITQYWANTNTNV